MSWDDIDRIFINETEQSSERFRPIVESEHKRERDSSPTHGLFLFPVPWDIAAKPESTEGRPWGQPLKKLEGAPVNLG